MAAAHGSMPEFGHAEPRRGTEWRGKSLWLLWALSKVTRRKGETANRPTRSNGYVPPPQLHPPTPPPPRPAPFQSISPPTQISLDM
ncbi:hypothetical protein PproGo58_21380 [Pseudomonas protegens]|nr:hypothetical protein PproGo58_21380 [Pseudomonas protegens]